MIDRERLLELHRRIRKGDPAAAGELFALVHRGLTATIWKRPFARRNWETAADLATDAIVEYLKAPEKFDDSKSSLFSYLVMIARGDALNYIRTSVRKQEGHDRVVELSAAEGNPISESADFKVDADRIMTTYRNELIKDAGDEEVLRLYLAGENETAAYAEALKLEHLSFPEQKKQVKTRRDRIEQRLKRLKETLE